MSLVRLLPLLGDRLDRIIAPTPLDPEGKEAGTLDWAITIVKDKIPDLGLLDGYYRGDHRISFTATEKWRTQFGKLIKSLNANYCPAVVDAMVDRLRLADITIARDGEPDPDATQVLIDAFRDNRFDRRAGQMHALAARHGEAYLMVWPHPDTGRPAYYPHTADMVAAAYDPDRPGELAVLAKVWMENRRCRVTLYFRDRIERWATANTYSGIPVNAKGFQPYDEDGEPAVFGHPYGRVPWVPFLNNTTDGMSGRSELVDVLPIQDTLNKSLADMFVAMEYAGFPQRYATGLEPESKDPLTGEPFYPFVAGVERLFTSSDPQTTFGQFQAADLTQFVTVQDGIRSDIARVSRTPLHYLLLSGTFPSGEALHTADAPMQAKIEDRQDDYGESWEDLAMLTLLVAGTATPANIAEFSAEASWIDTSPQSDVARAQYAQLAVDLGASQDEGLRLIGYDAADIEAMRQEKEDNATTALDSGSAAGNFGGQDAARALLQVQNDALAGRAASQNTAG